MEEFIASWLSEDRVRMQALAHAATLELPDWCLAGGFVRNLVWDKLHAYAQATPLNDIDLIYFDPVDASRETDLRYETRLRESSPLPWSVKNQARMHVHNADPPYRSTADAMSHWVETETAIGVRLLADGRLEIVAPLGLLSLIAGRITLNAGRPKPDEFRRRIEEKRWLELWPSLKVERV